MSNPYDSMVGFVSQGKTFSTIAFASCLVACTAYPELLMPLPATKSGFLLKNLEKSAMGGGKTMGIPIPGMPKGTSRAIGLPKSVRVVTDASKSQMALGFPMRIFMIRTDTAAMMKACSHIHEAAEVANKLSKEIRQHGDTITEQTWQADDQKVFAKQIDMYRISIDATMQLGYVNAALTAVVATLRFIQITICMALMGALAILAVAFWALIFIPFCQGAAMSIRNAGRPIYQIARKLVPLMEQIMVYTGWAQSGASAALTLNAAAVDSYKVGDIEGGGGWQALGNSAVATVGDLLKKYERTLANAIPGK